MVTEIEAAFPTLDAEEMSLVRRHADRENYSDGEYLFKAGQAAIDLFIVESGLVDILNPTDGNSLVATHEPHTFVGDIDLLTRRPVIVSAVAKGEVIALRIRGPKIREVLSRVPRLGEKMLTAFVLRREALAAAGVLGLKVVGPGRLPGYQHGARVLA